MSKKLDEEYKKYGEFYDDLKSVSQAKEEGIDLADAKTIVKDYKKKVSLTGFVRFWSEYEADTPEETEVLEICKEVRGTQNIKHNMKVCGGISYLMGLGLTCIE